MQSLRENAMILRRDGRKGVSLVIAMCASALLLLLGSGLPLSAGALLRQEGKKVTRERCLLLAHSFEAIFQEALLKRPMEEVGQYVASVLAAQGESLCRAEGDDAYGQVYLRLKKVRELEGQLPQGSIPWEDAGAVEALLETEVPLCLFTVEVSVEWEGERGSCITPYLQSRRCDLCFSYEGTPVYWQDGWYLDEAYTQALACAPGTRIDYRCETAPEVTYAPAWREGGGKP